MYINLILGLAAALAIFWLIRDYRRAKTDPKSLLEDELAKRRAAQEAARQAAARLESLRRERLVPVMEGLGRMRAALPAPAAGAEAGGGVPEGSFGWEDKGDRLLLFVVPPAGGTSGGAFGGAGAGAFAKATGKAADEAFGGADFAGPGPEGAGEASENAAGRGASEEGDKPGGSGYLKREAAVISWDVRNVDLASLALGANFSSLSGEYILRWPDGSYRAESDLSDFLRLVSAYIADKLV